MLVYHHVAFFVRRPFDIEARRLRARLPHGHPARQDLCMPRQPPDTKCALPFTSHPLPASSRRRAARRKRLRLDFTINTVNFCTRSTSPVTSRRVVVCCCRDAAPSPPPTGRARGAWGVRCIARAIARGLTRRRKNPAESRFRVHKAKGCSQTRVGRLIGVNAQAYRPLPSLSQQNLYCLCHRRPWMYCDRLPCVSVLDSANKLSSITGTYKTFVRKSPCILLIANSVCLARDIEGVRAHCLHRWH